MYLTFPLIYILIYPHLHDVYVYLKRVSNIYTLFKIKSINFTLKKIHISLVYHMYLFKSKIIILYSKLISSCT